MVVAVDVGDKGIPLCHSHNVTEPVALGCNFVIPTNIIPSSGASK
jgi:hypothetical protein